MICDQHVRLLHVVREERNKEKKGKGRRESVNVPVAGGREKERSE